MKFIFSHKMIVKNISSPFIHLKAICQKSRELMQIFMLKSMWMCKKWQVDLRLVQKAPYKSWRLLAKLETRIRKENIKYHFCSILIPKQREIIIVFKTYFWIFIVLENIEASSPSMHSSQGKVIFENFSNSG